MTRPLEGRSAIITGANQGLGLEIARAYISAGANVLICAREAGRLEEARVDLQRAAGPQQLVLAQTCDVSKPDDVDRVATSAVSAFSTVQILVNNAGIYGPMGFIEDVDWHDWVRTVEINLFGSILMCRALLRHFKQQRYGKIVQLSGGGATNPLPRISGYAASKAAIIRFAESLAEEVRGLGIDVNAIAPGGLNTRMLDQALAAGAEGVGQGFYDRMLKQKEQGGASLDRAAALAVYLASAASDGITAKLLSAVWDPWETLRDHREDLQRTDVYTVRRIVPSDRGLPWDKK